MFDGYFTVPVWLIGKKETWRHCVKQFDVNRTDGVEQLINKICAPF